MNKKVERGCFMGLFKNVPTSKKAQIVGDKVMALSQELKEIILSYNCVDLNKISINGLEYALFMYDLECYRQLMTIKHDGFFIETTLRTIFITMESNNKRAGVPVKDGYMFDMFKKLSNSLHQVYGIAVEQGIDGLYGIAMYLCSDECGMSQEEIDQNQEMVLAVSRHFNKIINLPI